MSAANFAQRLLIRRCARALLRLQLLDGKMAGGNWTDTDARMFSALSNIARLCLRELGVATAPEKLVTLDEIAARHGTTTRNLLP
jgi:hypothetical protein